MTTLNIRYGSCRKCDFRIVIKAGLESGGGNYSLLHPFRVWISHDRMIHVTVAGDFDRSLLVPMRRRRRRESSSENGRGMSTIDEGAILGWCRLPRRSGSSSFVVVASPHPALSSRRGATMSGLPSMRVFIPLAVDDVRFIPRDVSTTE